MDESEVSEELQRDLAERWWLPLDPGKHALTDRNALLDALTRRVHHLMTHDMQRLLTAMYVLDIGEDRFRAALSGSDAQEAAHSLAQIILDRELEKAASRQKYAEEE